MRILMHHVKTVNHLHNTSDTPLVCLLVWFIGKTTKRLSPTPSVSSVTVSTFNQHSDTLSRHSHTQALVPVLSSLTEDTVVPSMSETPGDPAPPLDCALTSVPTALSSSVLLLT